MQHRLLSDRYRLEECLRAADGWALYRAVDVAFPRHVRATAVFRRDPSKIEPFRARVQSLAALSHPHILSLYDLIWEADGCWLISENHDCCTLRDAIQQGRRFSLEEAVVMAIHIAGAIAYAHQQYVVHGQLATDKIWVFDRDVKVDFASPYALLAADPVELRADLASLGGVLRELFAAVPDGEKPEAQARIGELLDCLTGARQPAYTNAAAVAYDLQMFLAKEVRPPGLAEPYMETTRVWEWRRATGESSPNGRQPGGLSGWLERLRLRLLPYLAVLSGALLAGGAVFFLRFPHPDNERSVQLPPSTENRPVQVVMAEPAQAASTVSISPAEPISRPVQRERLVPELVGLQQQEAEKLLLSLGLRYQYYLERSDLPPGTVFKQVQAPNSPYQPGERVIFYVSSGKS